MKSLYCFTLVCLVVLSGCDESFSHDSFEFQAPISQLTVDVSTGSLILEASHSETWTVDVAYHCRTVVPEYEVYLAGSTLHVELTAPGAAASCTGTIRMSMPADLSANLRTGLGDIFVEGIRGDLALDSLAGDLTVIDGAGELSLATPSGVVTGLDLRSRMVSVALGSGDSFLSFTHTPRQVDVDIIIGQSDVTVPAADYRIETAIDRGEMHLMGVETKDSADRILRTRIDDGDGFIRLLDETSSS